MERASDVEPDRPGGLRESTDRRWGS